MDNNVKGCDTFTQPYPDFRAARDEAVDTALKDVLSLSYPTYTASRWKDVGAAHEKATEAIRARVNALYDTLRVLDDLEGRKPSCCICGEHHA